MGTRGACGFRIGGVDKVMYNGHDSYPDWLGKEILEFIQKRELNDICSFAEKIVLVDRDEKIDGQTLDYILQEYEGQLGKMYDKKEYRMISSSNFLKDSLFCEWAYIINIDEKILEVYRGFNKNKSNPGRYSKYKDDDNGYYGVVLIRTYPLEEIKDLKNGEVIKELEGILI